MLITIRLVTVYRYKNNIKKDFFLWIFQAFYANAILCHSEINLNLPFNSIV